MPKLTQILQPVKTFIMKKICISLPLFIISIFLSNSSCRSQTCAQAWTMEKATKWFEAKEWTNGLSLKVYDSVNKLEFAKQYNKNKAYWDKAFTYLKNTNLDTVSPGKYYLDGNNVFVSVTMNKLKPFENTKWEAHRKYVDIQYVIKGKEKMGVAPFSKAKEVEVYDETKDVGFYAVADVEGKFYKDAFSEGAVKGAAKYILKLRTGR